jgi:hypothetical protein
MRLMTSKGVVAVRQCGHVCQPRMVSGSNLGTCGACGGLCDCEPCEVRITDNRAAKKGGKR